MEPYAAKTCLLSLLSFDLPIASFTTDRSSTIATMMTGDPRLSHIRHEYDIWHFISKFLVYSKLFILFVFILLAGRVGLAGFKIHE